MHTSYGHSLRVPSEALQRSRGGGATDTVDMITSVFSSHYLQRNASILEELVLGVWVGHQDVSNLSEPIKITFWRTPNARTDDGQCVFWDESNGVGNWSSEGCVSNHTTEELVCSCNHLSFFAVMLSHTEGTQGWRIIVGQITVAIISGLMLLDLLSYIFRKVKKVGFFKRNRPPCDDDDDDDDAQHLNPDNAYESTQPETVARGRRITWSIYHL